MPSPASPYSPLKILKQYWGYDAFRPLQEEIIQSVLEGKDTLALMPTGGGKSLCYQVPAMALDGLCLVISPLIALMKDQVENLRKKQITAYAIYSGMSRRDVINTLKVAAGSNCRFLYVSPERLETKLFREYLPALDIRLIAVDEAHCISQWGYDFRPPYLRIAQLRDELPGVPVLALTASATTEVQEDMMVRLQFRQSHIFRQSFARPNLSYSVFRSEARMNKIKEVLEKVPGTGIVYCKSRRRCREISDLLRLQGFAADFYHAGLPQEERSKKQESWMRGETRVMVCTNAFGMGIDKPDVRTVIHADLPDCLENYYQEAGRAGRDGKKAYAVLLYNDTDMVERDEQAALRFPGLETIRNVYQAVANYLQIPTGAGEGQYYDFDLGWMLRQFKLNSREVIPSLQTLEQDSWLAFSEQVFLPATVQFTCGKDSLFELEKAQPAYDELVKTLLRTYEGIFDQSTAISEKQLAWLLKKPVENIVRELQQLEQWRLLSYLPQKDKPQLLLLRPRVKAEDLRIDLAAQEERKKRYLARLQEMKRYVTDTLNCRSRMIGRYFGDDKLGDCGVCDNCLQRKNGIPDRGEFERISERLLDIIREGEISVQELLARLPGIKKEKALQVIEFQVSEGRLVAGRNGLLRLK